MSLKPSPKLHPVGCDLLVVITVVILAVSVGIGLLGTSESGPLTAVISADGQPEERVVLSSLTEPEERVLHSGGYTLHLVLSADGVEMTTSDCPTQECVHTGKITRSGQSIVCLPARVIVTLEGGAPASGPDVVIG